MESAVPYQQSHDDMEGITPPRAQTQWIGHGTQTATLVRAISSYRMPQAWLFSGPRGIGKATCAYRLARYLLHDPGAAGIAAEGRTASPAHSRKALAVAPSTDTFRQIAAGAHPNMLSLARRFDRDTKRYRSAISVDDIRAVGRFFASTRARSGWRVCLIDTADDMTIQAANALLKLLEEPPPASLFILISHRFGRLLATLRSRCRRLEFHSLPAQEIAQGLRLYAPRAPQEAHTLAMHLADGSLRRALGFVDKSGIAVYQGFSAIIENNAADVSARMALAEKIAPVQHEAAYILFIDLVQAWLFRRINALQWPQEKQGTPLSMEAAAAHAEVWQEITEMVVAQDTYNLDRKQTVLGMLHRISALLAPRQV